MRLLLTSGGVTNTSIRDGLAGLLGKPIADSSALCIPTAEYGHPMCTPVSAWRFIARPEPVTHVRPGLEVGGRPRAHRAAQHRRGALDPLGPAG